MSRGALPTTDLYFGNACTSWISRWWRKGPVRRVGANCFASGNRLLLVRRDRPEVVQRALDWPGHVIYLIDDDIDGAALSPGLPAPYRDRLADFARGDYDKLLRRADRVVVSAAALAARLAEDPRVTREPDVLDPFWSAPLAGSDHFEPVGDEPIEVVHLGSGSHEAGLRMAMPAILAMLEEVPLSRFTYVGRPGTHPAIEVHPRVRRVPPMTWPRYRRWLPRQRFHLGLYPLASEAFDRARSANKLIEHGVVGAVGCYPSDWAPATQLGDGAILAPPDPAEWTATLLAASADRRGLARRAAVSRVALERYADPQGQRRFWAEAFGWE